MKKLISSLLVLGVVLPGIASASVVDDLQDRVVSLRETLASLIDLFSINYPEQTLGLVIPTSVTVVAPSSSVTISWNYNSTTKPMVLSAVALATTTIKVGGPRVSYKATIINPNTVKSKPFSGVAIQGWLEQSKNDGSSTTVRLPAGGALVVCNGATSQIGLVYPGTCSTSFTFGVNSSSLLTTGPAQAIFELKLSSAVVDRKVLPIKLIQPNGTPQPSSTITLAVAKDAGLGTPTYASGQSGAKIGSYVISAPAAQGVNLTTMSVRTLSGGFSGFSNLKLMVGATQFGVTQPVVQSSSTYNYFGALNIPAGTSKVIDLYADILTSIPPGLYPGITQFVGCSGSGATTFNPASCNSAFGQDVRIGGQATVLVALDSASPVANQLVMGSVGNNLASFRFTETTNIEELKVTQLNIFDSVASTATVKPAFSNLTIYQGATLLGTAGSGTPSQDGKGYYYTVNFSQPIFVPKAGSVSVMLKGDVSSYASSGATDNTTHVFKIATSTDPGNSSTNFVIALGRTSNATSAVVLSSPVGNTQTVLRTKLGVASTLYGGSASYRPRTTNDDLAKVTFTADAAGDVVLNTMTITFSGGANSSTLPSTANLIDDNTGTTLGGATIVRTTSNSVTFGNIGYSIAAGTSKAARIRINTNNTNNTSQQADSLALTINAASDVQYTTGNFGGTPGIPLPIITVPLTLVSVSYE